MRLPSLDWRHVRLIPPSSHRCRTTCSSRTGFACSIDSSVHPSLLRRPVTGRRPHPCLATPATSRGCRRAPRGGRPTVRPPPPVGRHRRAPQHPRRGAPAPHAGAGSAVSARRRPTELTRPGRCGRKPLPKGGRRGAVPREPAPQSRLRDRSAPAHGTPVGSTRDSHPCHLESDQLPPTCLLSALSSFPSPLVVLPIPPCRPSHPP